MGKADSYRAAGVDLDQAETAKQRIGELVKSTRTKLTRGRIGAFGGMVRVPAGIRNPTLVLSTDGVGTKVLVAIAAGRHDTVGEDLVNHCVNDILVHGAKAIAFLDYLAAAQLHTPTVAAVVEGVARGCKAHGMSLAGGETAQLPDLYHPGHYDLAGTIVGVVGERDALHGDRVKAGDVLVAFPSSGLHTNGYTLARRIVFETLKLKVTDRWPDVGVVVADALLAVHRSYEKVLRPHLKAGRIHALAHITGGGIPGNLTRSLAKGLGAVIERRTWSLPPLFRALQNAGKVSDDEMFRVFNMGVGMIAAVPERQASVVGAKAKGGVESPWIIGQVVKGAGVRIV
ncbi:MAG TPA: phosphoribosylformylglycinamidine cyclo-ligase [Gemmatimonadales bacterium]